MQCWLKVCLCVCRKWYEFSEILVYQNAAEHLIHEKKKKKKISFGEKAIKKITQQQLRNKNDNNWN